MERKRELEVTRHIDAINNRFGRVIEYHPRELTYEHIGIELPYEIKTFLTAIDPVRQYQNGYTMGFESSLQLCKHIHINSTYGMAMIANQFISSADGHEGAERDRYPKKFADDFDDFILQLTAPVI